jgi:hypothetical protein
LLGKPKGRGNHGISWLRLEVKLQKILERTNPLLSFQTTRIAQKMAPPTILRCCGNVFTELLLSNDSRIHRQTNRNTRPTILLLLRAFVVVGTCRQSRCLAMNRGMDFTKPLPSNEKRNTHVDTQTDERD